MGETENLTLFPPDVPAASPDIAAATTCLVLHDNEGPVEFSSRVIASWQQLERTTSCNYHGSTVEARQVLRYGALQLRQRAAEPITEVFLGPKAADVHYELLAAATTFFRERYESILNVDDFNKVLSLAEKAASVAVSDRENILANGNIARLHAIRAEHPGLGSTERLLHIEKSIESFGLAITKRENSETPYQKSDATLWVGAAQVLSQRYGLTHGEEDIELSISYLQRSVSGETPGSELWLAWSDRLARAYWTRYGELQQLEDVRKGVEIFESILSHHPRNPYASTGLAELLREICVQEVLSNSALRTTFSRIVELLEAIVVVTQAQDPSLPSRLGKCGSALAGRFRFDGVLQDIDLAIVLQHTALNLPQIKSSARWFHLKQICEYHILRHNRQHSGEDLEPALNAGRASFLATSPADQARVEAQLQFACAQATSYLHTHNDETLENAILNMKAAERLFTRVGWRSVSCLENLAGLLKLRFQRFSQYADAQEGIKYAREAIDILRRLSGKGNNSNEARALEILGGLMQARADRFRGEDDIDQAVNAFRDSMK